MRLAETGIGDIFLIDIAKGLACGKALDLEDARSLVKNHYHLCGREDIREIRGSDIIVVTAGMPRKPGMTREELANINARVIKEISLSVKETAPSSILIIVTNPLDLMTRLATEVTGFKPGRVFGMGVTLDAARFANLIACELQVPVTDIDSFVIGSHGEGMLPLPRLTTIKGAPLPKFLDPQKIEELVKRTILRGAEIVSLLGSGSAYFAPSAAIAELVRVIAKDEKRILGVSAGLNGEYGVSGVAIGVPCRIGGNGIENIIELDLDAREKQAFQKAAASLKDQYSRIKR